MKTEGSNEWTFPAITSQLCGSEVEGAIIPYLTEATGPPASLPCSCDVITGKVYYVKARFVAISSSIFSFGGCERVDLLRIFATESFIKTLTANPLFRIDQK